MDEAEQQSNDDIEITDLPGEGDKPRNPRSRQWRAVTAGILMLLAFVVSGSVPQFGSNSRGFFWSASSTLSGSSVIVEQVQIGVISQLEQTQDTKKIITWDESTPPVVSLGAALDAAPQSCLQYSSMQNFDTPYFPPGVGGDPMWVTGFSGPRATLDHLTRASDPRVGWYETLELVSSTNYPGTITLAGGVANTSLPLWFSLNPPSSAPNGTSLFRAISVKPLDTSLSNHTTSDQQWDILPINLYIPQAGCYFLSATWDSGGSWAAFFAAGR